MTQLSRKQKYQELRDRLDEETTAAQAQPVKLQRLSRVDSGSHANKPLYPHDTVRVSPTVKEMPTSPVMEDLLGEVKHIILIMVTVSQMYTDQYFKTVRHNK